MSSKTIAVVFHSATGTTETIAEQIAAGVDSVTGVTSLSLKINDTDIVNGRYPSRKLDIFDDVDGIVFGSPTFMGGVSAQFKALADASSEQWSEGRWRNKLAAGFTIGVSASGEQAITMQYLQTLAAQHGMLWVGIDSHPLISSDQQTKINPLGASTGVIATEQQRQVHRDYLATAFYLGNRMAKLVS